MGGNIDKEEYTNFTGKACEITKTAEELVSELQAGFLSAQSFVSDNWEALSRRYNLEERLDDILRHGKPNRIDDKTAGWAVMGVASQLAAERETEWDIFKYKTIIKVLSVIIALIVLVTISVSYYLWVEGLCL